MGTTLSPFRYIQLARYVVNRCIDHIPIPISTMSKNRKGKEKATTNYALHTQHDSERLFLSSAATATATATASQSTEAGPSRLRDQAHHHGTHNDKLDQPYRKLSPDPDLPPEPKEIYKLMNDHRLLVPSSVKPPRETVVLCHGLYGFSTATPIPLFPSLKLHYWASVLEVLRDRMDVDVVVVGVKGTGSIKERAEQMHQYLKDNLPKGAGINFVAHSMGGLDCRYLISHLKPTSYTPLSLTTIGTPHRGSPFMDWCAANIGVGSTAAAATAVLTADRLKGLPYSLKSPLLALPAQAEKATKSAALGGFTSALTKYLLSIFDSPAYYNLTTSYLRDHFNPSTPNASNVKYISVAGRISKMSVLHPLWFPKVVLDAAEENGYAMESALPDDKGKRMYEGNDGLVPVGSAKWGEFLGVVDECHHWELRGEGGLFPTGASTSSTTPNGGGKKENKVEDALSALGMSQENRKEVTDYLGLGDSVEERKVKSEQKSTKGTSSSSSWDIAQVGQVLDWVTDILPGQASETSKKQLADAQREKDKEIHKEKEREKKKKEKFDLTRFYGGLMLKLRDEGF